MGRWILREKGAESEESFFLRQAKPLKANGKTMNLTDSEDTSFPIKVILLSFQEYLKATIETVKE